MADRWLEDQIAREKAELENAPKIPLASLLSKGGPKGRCSWCGQFSQDLVYVDTIHGVARFKGSECCGRPYVKV
jgi:hypothetical protein